MALLRAWRLLSVLQGEIWCTLEVSGLFLGFGGGRTDVVGLLSLFIDGVGVYGTEVEWRARCTLDREGGQADGKWCWCVCRGHIRGIAQSSASSSTNRIVLFAMIFAMMFESGSLDQS